MTLGAVLMLGGMNGSRSDELSDSVGVGSVAPSGGFALPSLPENWADMPFRLTASDVVAYNSNIFSAPRGTSVPGQPLGDFTSTSSVGVSTSANWFGQKLFFDGTYGLIRYLHQVEDDANIYSFSAGDNWILTSRCKGSLIATLNKTPSTIIEQVGTGINYSTTTAVNETGGCDISNGYSFVFNSGWTKYNNSNSINSFNNSQTLLLSAGIEYSKGYDSLTGLASISDTSFSQRNGLANTLGLASTVDFHSFTLNYQRRINDNLSLTGEVGLVGVTNAFGLGLPKTLLPIYSFSASWAITPKTALTASAARTVAPPTAVVANAQTTYNANLGLTYQATPKLGFSAGASVGYSSSSFTPAFAGTAIAPFLTSSNYYSAQAAMTYSMTPFITAALTAAYTERVSNHLVTPQDIVTVSLNYRPY